MGHFPCIFIFFIKKKKIIIFFEIQKWKGRDFLALLLYFEGRVEGCGAIAPLKRDALKKDNFTNGENRASSPRFPTDRGKRDNIR